MAGIITSGDFAKALWPGVNAWYGKAYDQHEKEYPMLFDKFTDSRGWVEDVGLVGFGLMAQKPEGGGILYDSTRQGFTTRYVHLPFGLGFIVTKEAFDDDQYDVIAQRKSESLAFSVNQTLETLGANVYNRAFNTSYLGGDGVAMCVNNHPNISGGTWSNVLATAADISEAALEQASIQIENYTNDRGLRIKVIPQSVIITPDQEFETNRILKSQYRVGTNNNDINALMALKKFPKGIIVNHYLTDTDAWFLRTNAPHGMKMFERTAPVFDIDNDFDTKNAKFAVYWRGSFGWTDARGVFGSPGA